jgi:hypothetical protein
MKLAEECAECISAVIMRVSLSFNIVLTCV